MRGLLALALMGSTTMCSTSGAEATFPRQQTSELPRTITGPSFEAHSSRRLAVVVPAHAGDLSRVVESLERWPRTCSPITKQHADLVLYYAEGTDEKLDAVVPILTETAGSCFANTKIVYAHLAEEEDVYPRGPSAQFYKMFLDENVSSKLSEYDAFAIIEWDVLVAHDRSFEQLYHAAFDGTEDFWVKGSTLEGTNFHQTATMTDMWHVMGHINGNAIYNNNDPAFVEYVGFTLVRWGYTYPYDVALWATIADFPYSWPLWQRYSAKFVTTNLISNVGFVHVDTKAVTDAVAGQTLFIHGSSVSEGSIKSSRAASKRRQRDDEALCESACTVGVTGAPDGTSTICDATCSPPNARFDGFLCGAGDVLKYGPMCRTCYFDLEAALEADRQLMASHDDRTDSVAKHVIMCDTGRPPEANDCSEECILQTNTVCDASCGTGRHGDYNCEWRALGSHCRFCFTDVEEALVADEVAVRHGGRVIMCDTNEPPHKPVLEQVSVERARKLQAWKDNQRWKRKKKWQGDEEEGIEPKWQGDPENGEPPKWVVNEKWRENRCDEGCVRTSSDGTKGRICDSTCKGDGSPYGRRGCNAKSGQFGQYCRVCYNDEELAREKDTAEDRAIMCATSLPVEPYSSAARRELMTGADTTVSPAVRRLQAWKDNQRWKRKKKWQGDEEEGIEPKWQGDPENGEPPKWVVNEKWRENRCDEGCVRTSSDGTKGRICDSTCKGDGSPYGRRGCNAKSGQFGQYCRVCYNDEELAREKDTAEDRAIMCATSLPVEPYSSAARRELMTGADTTVSPAVRRLQAWKDNQRWKRKKKWQGDEEEGIEPKWQGDPENGEPPKWVVNEKWRENRCDEGCVRTSSDGTKGRICDSTCKGDGSPYGRRGCNAKSGQFGQYCRVCYNDEELAREKDTAEDRAIMCATSLPVEPYSSAARRELMTGADTTVSPAVRRLQAWKDNQRWKRKKKWQGDEEEGIEPKWQGDPENGEPPKWVVNEKWRENRCDEGCVRTSSDGTKGRICDSTCKGDGSPYGRRGCNAKSGQFGQYCRVCYNDEELAREKDTAEDRAIMCATSLPVEPYSSAARRELMTGADTTVSPAVRRLQAWKDNQRWKRKKKWQGDEEEGIEPKWQGDPENGEPPKWVVNEKWRENRCDEGCVRTSSDGTKGRICDSTCKGDGSPYGRRGCNAKSGQFGQYCRVCYNDEELAREKDTAEDRAIMCATSLPVEPYSSAARRELMTGADTTVSPAVRRLQAWKDNQRWKRKKKWQGDEEEGIEPKWQGDPENGEPPKWVVNEKWRENRCDEGCVRTSSDGTKGRICDSTCKGDGSPYGRRGCNAKSGQFGQYCRVCYNDEELAREKDTAEDRAIMCATSLPVEPYSSAARRELMTGADTTVSPAVRRLQAWKDNQRWKRKKKWQGDEEEGIEPKWQGDPENGEPPKWVVNEKWRENRCDEGCVRTSSDGTKGRICDSTCKGDGSPYGRRGCNAKSGQFGQYCRVCYNDEELAREKDTAEDRAIMCATSLPVEPYSSAARRELMTGADTTVSPAVRRLQAWKDNQRWKRKKKWQGDEEEGIEPKWQGDPENGEPPKWVVNEKWRENRCDEGCVRTSSDGTKGRICDSTCKGDGSPYGRRGCNAKSGQFGQYCRVCYNDEELAREKDTAEDRAIMCATSLPVEPYSSAARRELMTGADTTVSPAVRRLQAWKDNQRWKRKKKWQGDEEEGIEPKWQGDPENGEPPKWVVNEKWRENRCDEGCVRTSSDGTKGRICDSTCKGDGSPYGRRGCNAKSGQFGQYCRVCYNDEELAREKDTAEDRAIMCATSLPVEPYSSAARRELMTGADTTVSPAVRRLQAWKDNQRWKRKKKWQGDEEEGIEPKWQGDPENGEPPKWVVNEKWRENRCDEGCVRTSSDGTKGRICDSTCKGDGSPYGRRGCNAKSGQFGQYCRVCYNDEELAREKDTAEDRAIMCATGLPVEPYGSDRRLTSEPSLPSMLWESVRKGNTGFNSVEEREVLEAHEIASNIPFNDELVRGELCTFIPGESSAIDENIVAVLSIVRFFPGMRVAIAAEEDCLEDYLTALGSFPGVSVSKTTSVRASGLFADAFCGNETKLIYYMSEGTILSRTFTSKDTHSPRGDLIVLYSDRQISGRDVEVVRATMGILGFTPPSFTSGTDLILPVGINVDLRNRLISEFNVTGTREEAAEELASIISQHEDISVPQVLAALSFSRNTPGIWFVDPQAWTMQHVFKEASIWDIPLLKPRFSCGVEHTILDSGLNVADTLVRSLDFFSDGGTCENGLIHVDGNALSFR